jgi:hypothetical protein
MSMFLPPAQPTVILALPNGKRSELQLPLRSEDLTWACWATIVALEEERVYKGKQLHERMKMKLLKPHPDLERRVPILR